MWQIDLNWLSYPDNTISSTAGSILATTAAQYFTLRSSQLESDILGWIFVLFLVKYIRRLGKQTTSSDILPPQTVLSRTGSCWVVAGAIAAASLSSSENNLPGILLPALIPALLLIERRLNTQGPVLTREGESGGWKSLAITITGSGAALLFTVCALAGWDLPSLLGIGLSIIELLALLAVYGTLLPKPASVSEAISFVDIEADIELLVPRVVGVLLTTQVFQASLLGFVWFDPGMMLLAGVAKAFAWFFVMETTRELSWTVAPVISTLALLATSNPFRQSFEIQSFSHVVGFILMLGQLMVLIPKHVPYRRILWAFSVIPAFPYLVNLLSIHTANSRAVALANTHEHPIEIIINQANVNFENLLMRQSKSYTAACEEYRRRYNFEPPPGFEEWFKYANSHDSRIIDDFDAMYESIIPLWNFSGPEISQAMKDVQLSSDNEVWTCKFSGQAGTTECVHKWRSFDRHVSTLFNQVIGDVKGILPDVEFLVNHLDEPRVIFSGEQKPSGHKSRVGSKKLAQTPAWESLVKTCPKSQGKNTTFTIPDVNSSVLPFVQDTAFSRDLCEHFDYRDMHALLMNPTSYRLIENMVPVLSTGSLSTMGDILFPSPAYIESEFLYDEKYDLDWSSKKNNLYWAGSTTGAFARDFRWKNYHRQRFVSLVQMLGKKEYAYLADNGGTIQLVVSSFLNSRLFEVAFTRIFQCTRKICHEQSFFYRTKAWADKNQAFRSRLTFDLDGNGISGRWYKMVASKSAPLKQTILHEWHDDRLLPWVHFIPVSLGMEELPELVMYLSTTKQGQQRAKEIADRGREWYFQALRDVDMGVYLYRLLLELSRLQDPKRLVSIKP